MVSNSASNTETMYNHQQCDIYDGIIRPMCAEGSSCSCCAGAVLSLLAALPWRRIEDA